MRVPVLCVHVRMFACARVRANVCGRSVYACSRVIAKVICIADVFEALGKTRVTYQSGHIAVIALDGFGERRFENLCAVV